MANKNQLSIELLDNLTSRIITTFINDDFNINEIKLLRLYSDNYKRGITNTADNLLDCIELRIELIEKGYIIC